MLFNLKSLLPIPGDLIELELPSSKLEINQVIAADFSTWAIQQWVQEASHL